MKTKITKECILFNLTNITEKEIRIITSLLNISDIVIGTSLKTNKNLWDDSMGITEAVTIGINLRNKINDLTEILFK